MTILPECWTRCSPVMYGGPSSAPSNRYGWLHTFLQWGVATHRPRGTEKGGRGHSNQSYPGNKKQTV